MTRILPAERSRPSVSPLVRAIHGASVSDSEWPAVLEQLRQHFDARVATLVHHHFGSGSNAALFAAPSDPAFSAGIAAYAARNPWFLSSEAYVAGRVLTGDELISEADLRRTDFYRGFLQPRGLLHRLCGVVAQHGDSVQLLSVYRAEDQPPFGEHEKAEMELLLHHVTLSLESQWRCREAQDMARALLALTDQDASAVVLLDAQAEPVYRNAAADRLLAQRIGICLEAGRLRAAHPADQRLLGEAIGRAAAIDDVPPQQTAPSVVTLAGQAANLPVVAVVRAAGQVFARQLGERRGLVMLVIRGHQALHAPESCIFARRYELTAAQAKVSALVFAGQSLASIARSLNVSENTVRSHLKQIFQKTDTHGQMDLVHLHARICPALA